MSLFFNGSRRERSPFDQQAAPWVKAAEVGRLLGPIARPALKPLPNEPQPKVNHHVLEIGPQKLLHEHGSEVVSGIINPTCPFAYDWSVKEHWLVRAFQEFYPPDQEFVGWYSLTTARRPAQLRDPNRIITITQQPAEISYLPRYTILPSWCVGFRFETRHFASPDGAPRTKCRVAMAKVPRYLSAGPHGIAQALYYEYWFCLAMQGDHEGLLKNGRIPAVPEIEYNRYAIQVRKTVILTLVKLSRYLWCTVCAIEFHPENGTVLSIRKSLTFPVGQTILTMSPIEYQGLSTLLGA